MGVSAARFIQMQCGHEYGVDNEGDDACVSELLKLTRFQLKDIAPK